MSLLEIKHLTGNRRNEEAIMFGDISKGFWGYKPQTSRRQEVRGLRGLAVEGALQTWGVPREPKVHLQSKGGHLCLPDTAQELSMENPELVSPAWHHNSSLRESRKVS